MGQGLLPQEVLADALAEAIGGRRVRTAVFTTYSFDPGFFELHILPNLFSCLFSQVEKVKRIQLEDQLRSLDEIAVYYDRTALSQDALPAQLDFRRIDVRRTTGVFHPKVVLLLVENPNPWEDDSEDEPTPGPLSLIVGALSANLTRAGWWENVETGHFEEIPDRDLDNSRCPFRQDVLELIRRLRQSAAEGQEHAALDRIHRFLLRRTSKGAVIRRRARGRQYTRLYLGQADLPSWYGELGLSGRDWNLEIISPYFDRHDAGTLERLIDELAPQETRVYLPKNVDGSARVTSDLYQVIAECAYWSALPPSLLRPGARGATEKMPERRVHAKVYRLWRRGGPDITLTGSVNLTAAAHSHGNAGNLEAAFLVDITDQRFVRWWLKRIDQEPQRFMEEQPDETEESQVIFIDISFYYDWGTEKLSYRIEGESAGPLEIGEPGGKHLFRIETPRTGKWQDCGSKAASEVRQLLPSTSFLQVKNNKGVWRVLVREEGMCHRPSLLKSLTPEEILRYWSLLSPEQRETFVEEKLAAGESLEGLRIGNSCRYVVSDTIFDRFAGVYHAFGHLQRHVDQAIKNNEYSEAVARMFGAKYDSLPVLLQETLSRHDGDPVMSYVTFLSAKQTHDRIAKDHPKFWRDHRKDAKRLKQLLREVPRLREALFSPDDQDQTDFLDWYERMFLREIKQPEEVP